MAKRLIRLTESDLRGIVENSVRKVLNEISPELKARAMVKANNNLQQLNKSNNSIEKNLNGAPVHKDTQKRRRDRQIMAFRRGLENDMRRKFNKDVKFGINNSSVDDNAQFSVDYGGDTFRHYSDSDGGQRSSVFFPKNGQDIGNKDIRASEYLSNMVDAMAGYDSELKDHSPFNSSISRINDRANDVENINKYNKDKEDYKKRKEAHGRSLSDYDSLPWYKKPFAKKPLPFTDEKPMPPKIKTGHYFMPSEPESVYKRGEEIKNNHDKNISAYNKYLKRG